MKKRILRRAGYALLSALCLGLVPVLAQIKPPESASKVRRVLLYNKIGGWVHDNGSRTVREVMVKLAAKKGFELTQSSDEVVLTPENLKTFQVIVWNNTTNGGYSVTDTAARRAVLDYVKQGGGWFLIHGASWGLETWPEMHHAVGTEFSRHAGYGAGEFVLDREAKAHRELQWMVEGMPDIPIFTEEWDGYENNVRGLPGLTLVATVRNVSGSTALKPMLDESGEWPAAWAREVGQGRLIFNTLGHGHQDLMGQNDSLIPRMYWENLRFAAGDFQNGCTHPADPKFDPEARVNDGAMCSTVGLRPQADPRGLVVRKGRLHLQLADIPAGAVTIRVRDIRGAEVWERTLPAGTGEVVLDGAMGPGVYHLETAGPARIFRRRLALP